MSEDTKEVKAELIDTTGKVQMRSIWRGDEQRYLTYDGRECTYSLKMLDAVLGTTFAEAPTGERVAFIAYCIANRLDPVRRQVYFIKYQHSEPASFVTSWEVFLERAQRHPQFDGFENGIVWRIKTAKGWRVKRGQSCDFIEDAEHIAVGGWAKVYRNDISKPRYVEVPIREMMATKADGSPVKKWRTEKLSMSMKTPTSRALRQAFPEDLSSLYTDGETEKFAQDVYDERVPGMENKLPPEDLDALAEEMDREDGVAEETHSTGFSGVVSSDPAKLEEETTRQLEAEQLTKEDEEEFADSAARDERETTSLF